MSLISLPRKEPSYTEECHPYQERRRLGPHLFAHVKKLRELLREISETKDKPKYQNDPVLMKRKPRVKSRYESKPIKKDPLIEEHFTIHTEFLKKKAESLKKIKKDFIEKGIMKALYGQVEQKVKCASLSTEGLVVQKRSKLRELLLAEEVAYATEYISMCQTARAMKEEELQKRALKLKDEIERKRKEFAEQKLLQQKLASNEDARVVLNKRKIMELKEDQLWQIREKYALQEARREEERMYHDFSLKDMASLREKEEQHAKIEWERRKGVQEAFMEQIKWKQEKLEEERRMKEFDRMLMEEEVKAGKEAMIKEQEAYRIKKENAIREFREIMAREKEIKDKRKQEDYEISKTFCDLLRKEESLEKNAEAMKKDRLKKERDIFLAHSFELKQRKEIEDRQLNVMLDELNNKKREQIDADRRKLRDARHELFCSVLKEREQQIKEKQEREKREEELKRDEMELLALQMEQQRKLREVYEKTLIEKKDEYKCQLKQQVLEVAEAKKKQIELERESIRLLKAQNEKEAEEIKALVKNLPTSGVDHPMRAIFMTNPPKFVCPNPCPK